MASGGAAASSGKRWKYVSSRGYDEYLEKKGHWWIVRKLKMMAPRTIIWEYLESGRWTVQYKGLFRSLKFEFDLGQEVEANGYKISVSRDFLVVRTKIGKEDEDDGWHFRTYSFCNSGRMTERKIGGENNFSCSREYKLEH
ncbi:hypothetical protein PFISCL1PPCAC_14212 [Pristionchus fissidentatus]|uniref:Uncharacterized protein n=1 Tax=Pristionchus fissidentatus TaxID=1538716 RepID=A0AAV5VWN6_9BILA|nr:hypothetical protein PFISCL1PPCAC_14212 [Pristionchus fissidentatus]